MAAPSTTTYTLQTDEVAAGRMTVKLHSATAGLTVPSFSSIFYGKTNERYDTIPGAIEFDAMRVGFIEDYSVYPEGFWYKVISVYGEIQFILDDGNGDSHFFWGVITSPTGEFEELSIVDGQHEREGEIQLISVLAKIKETTAASMIAELETHLEEEPSFPSPSGNNEYSYYHTIRAMFASILKVTFGQTYSTADVIVPSHDIKFYKDGGAGEIVGGVDEIYLYYGEGTGGGAGFAFPDGMVWASFYKNCYDIAIAVAGSLFFVIRHHYDIATARHQFQLLTRGRSYAANTYETPIRSTLIREAYPPKLSGRSVRTYSTGENDQRWVFEPGDGSPIYSTAEIPALMDIDLQVGYLFPLRDTEEAFTSNLRAMYLFAKYGTPGFAVIGYCTFYDYEAGAFANEDYIALKYFFRRFSESKRGYRRTYPSLKANNGSTDTHANNFCMRTVTINDGLADRTYYAVEVEKEAFENECTITWHEK